MSGYVYLVTSPLLNGIKIGRWSGSLHGLRSRFVTSYGPGIAIQARYVANCTIIEKDMHAMFKGQCLGGELFCKAYADRYTEALIAQQRLTRIAFAPNPHSFCLKGMGNYPVTPKKKKKALIAQQTQHTDFSDKLETYKTGMWTCDKVMDDTEKRVEQAFRRACCRSAPVEVACQIASDVGLIPGSYTGMY